jgi:hypothetical protein
LVYNIYMPDIIHLNPEDIGKHSKYLLLLLPILIFVLILTILFSQKPKEYISSVQNSPSVMGDEITSP